MTTEREMLEFAAKACGYSLCLRKDGAVSIDMINEWNPLTNSADCAAMCAKLEINWINYPRSVDCGRDWNSSSAKLKDHNNDREAAWRYAATMVAAKIGGMK